MWCKCVKMAYSDRLLPLRSRRAVKKANARLGSNKIFECVFGVMLGKKSPLIDIYQFFCIIVSYFESYENTCKRNVVVDCKGCYGSY